jgi:predicted DNA-binding transcriptional regulator AlpA
MPQEEQFFSLKDVCERYRISRTTVWRWVRGGRLPEPMAMSLQTRRWRLSDLHEFEKKITELVV